MNEPQKLDNKSNLLGFLNASETSTRWHTYGFAVAEDTGGAIKGNRIDLFYNSNSQARRFGRRNVVVYVLED